jgi:hypothetical protein
MGVKLTVDVTIPHKEFRRLIEKETFDNDHRVVSQKSASTGRFTFTTAESGEHRLCFQTADVGGWFSSSHVRFHLNLAIGETGDIDRDGKDQSASLAQRVQNLNARLQDILREQVFQRVCLFVLHLLNGGMLIAGTGGRVSRSL